jgi:4-hydroxybenzoyl-CoA thioesterase
MSLPSFTRTETVRFAHIDFAGIVFYPRFLEMLNALVEDWFADGLDAPFSKMHQTHGIPTVNLQVQFKNPARLGEILTKKIAIKQLKSSSMVCAFAFENESASLVLEGEVTLVYVAISADRQSIQSSPFSEPFRQLLSTYLLES